MIRPPSSEDDLYAWILVLTVAYLGLAYFICMCRCVWRDNHPRPTSRFFVAKLFDGITFGSSLMLVMGIFYPNILALIGNMKPFLIIAGLGGIGWTMHSAFD